MDKLIYITFTNIDGLEPLGVATSGEVKAHYFIDQLKDMVPHLDVVIYALPAEKGHSCKEREIIRGNVKYSMPPCNKRKNKISRFLNLLTMQKWLYKHLVKNCTKDTTVVFYHSISLIKALKKAKRKIGFKLVGEVEEIYSYAPIHAKNRKIEVPFLKSLDAYIPITPKINRAVNLSNKPYAIYYGAFNIPPVPDKPIFEDGRKHIVYAGSFAADLGRGQKVLEISKYLPDDYQIEILVVSNWEEAKRFYDDFLAKNEKHCPIILHRKKTGKDYTDFLQSCQIGLNVQDSTAPINDYSMPSKFTVYLSNGLWVVGTWMEVLEESPFANSLTLVKGDNAEDFAKAIIECSTNYDRQQIQQVIKDEAERFRISLKELLIDD